MLLDPWYLDCSPLIIYFAESHSLGAHPDCSRDQFLKNGSISPNHLDSIQLFRMEGNDGYYDKE